MTDALSNLPWKATPPGICVTLINMHGDADAFTLHTAHFALTADGRRKAAQLLGVLDELHDVICADLEASLESVCDTIAARLGLEAAPLVEILNDLVRTDCRFNDYSACPVAYFVERCDEHGVLTRAQFPGRDGELVGYRQLSGVLAPCYLSPWAQPTARCDHRECV